MPLALEDWRDTVSAVDPDMLLSSRFRQSLGILKSRGSGRELPGVTALPPLLPVGWGVPGPPATGKRTPPCRSEAERIIDAAMLLPLAGVLPALTKDGGGCAGVKAPDISRPMRGEPYPPV